MFSTTEFSDWSKQHVMFLHVTTRLEDRKHDGLLKEKGFRGFPSLAFMDASGIVTARHAGQRDLEGLSKTAEKADAYLALRKKAESGDEVAGQHLFVQSLGLGHYDFARGSLRMAALRDKLPATLRADAEQKLIDLQYQELTAQLRKQLEQLGQQEYRRRWEQLGVEFFQANRLPSGYYARGVATSVMNYAERKKDATLFAKALEVYKQRVGDQKVYTRVIERYEERLQKLREDDGK
ncbi:MAG: hypothetical protein ACYS5W_14855 [Planctomycetota bacterium]